MVRKNNGTFSKRLLRDMDRGATIVCSVAPYVDREMEYAPRRKSDPSPWVLAGTAASFRYSGAECEAIWPNGRPGPAQPLGEVQKHCLEAMERNAGFWWAGGGWVWENYSRTLKIMRSLAKRDLVTQTMEGERKERFELTEAGREALKTLWALR